MPKLDFVIFCQELITDPYTLIRPYRTLMHLPEHSKAEFTINAFIRIGGLAPSKPAAGRFEFRGDKGELLDEPDTSAIQSEEDGMAELCVVQKLQAPLPRKIELRVLVAGKAIGSAFLPTEVASKPASDNSTN